MKALIIDNYDSFTYNLYQLVGDISGHEPVVVRNDQLSWEELLSISFDCIIISPGPGHPERARDFGISKRAILEMEAPLLGVCLGHQGICNAFGGQVVHAIEPVHGRISAVFHDDRDLFAGLPNPFGAVRYHSLQCKEPLPHCLVKTAWTADGTVMGLAHRTRPLWGIQFHPESACTYDGRQLIENFLALCRRFPRPFASAVTLVSPPKPDLRENLKSRDHLSPDRPQLFVRRAPLTVETSLLFEKAFGDNEVAIWLDSSFYSADQSRFSIMAAGDEDAEIVRYDAWRGRLTVERGGASETLTENLFDYLNRMLATRYADDPSLPFSFNCGYVGYFGYELKALCGAAKRFRAPLPDAILLFADRSIVVDHADRSVYFLYLDAVGDDTKAEAWFSRIFQRLAAPSVRRSLETGIVPQFQPAMGRSGYLEQIRRCLDYIRNGESYEICLTNQLTSRTNLDPFQYYQELRLRNPAPFGAYLRFPEASVASCSPERFLCVSREGVVETKPIKGTVRRGGDPIEDARLRDYLERDTKSRAENLMIVDLLRNDLGRVCRLGTVEVSRLMNVESFATVHQLVSTIRGALEPGKTAVDCLHAAFPGGSMTGAPKLRTMEILDSMEGAARGVYSGSIGYLSLNGAADMNIVIRTAVFSGGLVSIGVGGAIVALSDPVAEWNEIMLKGRALLETFGPFTPVNTTARSTRSL